MECPSRIRFLHCEAWDLIIVPLGGERAGTGLFPRCYSGYVMLAREESILQGESRERRLEAGEGGVEWRGRRRGVGLGEDSGAWAGAGERVRLKAGISRKVCSTLL